VQELWSAIFANLEKTSTLYIYVGTKLWAIWLITRM